MGSSKSLYIIGMGTSWDDTSWCRLNLCSSIAKLTLCLIFGGDISWWVYFCLLAFHRSRFFFRFCVWKSLYMIMAFRSIHLDQTCLAYIYVVSFYWHVHSVCGKICWMLLVWMFSWWGEFHQPQSVAFFGGGWSLGTI